MKEGNKNSKYHIQIGAGEACTNRMMESTKGLDQRDMKGATNNCFILTVGSHQRSCQKL